MNRKEKNGYRIYSEEDVRQIKKIAYLRTLGVPVEAIQKMIRGEATLNHVLKLQNKKLEKELLELEQAKQLCSHMLKDEALTFQNLEPDKYVGSVKDYWEDNRPALKKDRASFIYLWGSWILWGILTLLCLVTAAAGYVLIPGRLPIQWSDGAVASSVDKVFIFPIHWHVCLSAQGLGHLYGAGFGCICRILAVMRRQIISLIFYASCFGLWNCLQYFLFLEL